MELSREEAADILSRVDHTLLKAFATWEDIEKLMGVRVNLQLWVKVRPDWRNNLSDLKTLGYESK